MDGYAEFPGEDYPLTPLRRGGMGRVSEDAVLEKIPLARSRYPR